MDRWLMSCGSPMTAAAGGGEDGQPASADRGQSATAVLPLLSAGTWLMARKRYWVAPPLVLWTLFVTLLLWVHHATLIGGF